MLLRESILIAVSLKRSHILSQSAELQKNLSTAEILIALNMMTTLVFLGIWSILRFMDLKAFVLWLWNDTFAGLLKTQFNRSCSIAIMASLYFQSSSNQ